MILKDNDVILFDGDSITDACRDRADKSSLSGYNLLIANTLREFNPNKNVTFYNRGVSGERSHELLLRLEQQLKEIKPTVYSLLIGINDVWRKFDSNLPTTAKEFAANIDRILTIVNKYTDRIIILEPFLISSNDNYQLMREDLMPKISELRAAAASFKTEYIPLDGIFAEHSIKLSSSAFSVDSVHPTPLGNTVIAKEFLSRVSF